MLFQAHVLPSHGNYLVMPYMPPSKGSYSLPRVLFAAIARGEEWSVGTRHRRRLRLSSNVGDQGGSDSGLLEEMLGPNSHSDPAMIGR